MPPAVYETGVHLWHAAYDKLPEDCKKRPPNICIMQTYRRSKGDFMDARQSFGEQEIMQALNLTTTTTTTATHLLTHPTTRPTTRPHHSPCLTTAHSGR